MTPPALNTPPSEGDIFFTTPTEKHKSESILQVSRKCAVRHCEPIFETSFTFLSVVCKHYRVPRFLAVNRRRTPAPIEYGRALFPLFSRPSPRGRQGAPFAPRRGLPPPQERAGESTRGRSHGYGRPPLDLLVSVLLPLSTNKGQNFLSFLYTPLQNA